VQLIYERIEEIKSLSSTDLVDELKVEARITTIKVWTYCFSIENQLLNKLKARKPVARLKTELRFQKKFLENGKITPLPIEKETLEN